MFFVTAAAERESTLGSCPLVEIAPLPFVIGGKKIDFNDELAKLLLSPSADAVKKLARFLRETHLEPVVKDVQSRFGPRERVGLRGMMVSRGLGFSVDTEERKYQVIPPEGLERWFREARGPLKISQITTETREVPELITNFCAFDGSRVFNALYPDQRWQVMIAVVAVGLEFFEWGRQGGFFPRKDAPIEKRVVLAVYPVRQDVFR